MVIEVDVIAGLSRLTDRDDLTTFKVVAKGPAPTRTELQAALGALGGVDELRPPNHTSEGSAMDFRFTDEQQLWHETLHRFMEKEVGREYTREHDASREFPEEAYRKMADLGWLGI